jgi:glycosyltransferase involved in cell wall biosynthesis
MAHPHVSEMAVWSKRSNESFVKQISPSNRLLKFFWNRIMILSSRFGLDRLVGFGGWILRKKSYFKSADIIHLHLIHNFTNFSILSLPFISKLKPVVWTLHDLWPLTGGCEHSFDCRKWENGCSFPCPYPRATSIFKKTAPHFHWKLKKYLYGKSNITLVVSSDWMLERVKKSPLLTKFDCIKIPFGIDLGKFKLLEKSKAKSELGIPVEHKVIAFRANSLKSDKFKGIKYIHEALDMMDPNEHTTVLIFENGDEFEFYNNKFNIIKLGWVDQNKLILALNSADVFMMPSLQESFGLMAIEAMACATPVVAFSGTALEEIIKDGVTGIIVPIRNSQGLAEAVTNLINDDNIRLEMGKKARELVEIEYSEEKYLQKHLELYNMVYNKFHNVH